MGALGVNYWGGMTRQGHLQDHDLRYDIGPTTRAEPRNRGGSTDSGLAQWQGGRVLKRSSKEAPSTLFCGPPSPLEKVKGDLGGPKLGNVNQTLN